MTGLRSRACIAASITAAVLACAAGCAQRGSEVRPEAPRALDDRLTITLVASEPDIVTPIGIAIDARDRIYVLESHTHLEGSGYQGPDSDRIQVFADRGGRRGLELLATYADGFDDGMGLTFAPSGDLYLVTARGVWRLRDRDGDLVSEERTQIIRMTEPPSVYAHAALMGAAISPDGWLYVSRGNTGGSPWRLEGSDGSAVSGYGDGGSIVRSRLDGGQVEPVATGFWNPFDLTFDPRGRLIATDNDPDSRGPNRLVHIVPGGDYGYKSLYGGSGVHPYQAWNGELPGTLPYAAPLGEAPSGLIDASVTALPADYAGSVLVAIWEESTIVRVALEPRGTSVAGTATAVFSGGTAFRPVSFAASADGTVYLTDWGMRQYPNHGLGRIWRIATAPGIDRLKTPRSSPEPAGGDAAAAEAQRLEQRAAQGDFAAVRDAFMSADPFVRHAAVVAADHAALRPALLRATTDADPLVRTAAALALERARYSPAEPVVRRLLGDPDPRVRHAALLWAGRAGLTAVARDLDRVLEPPAGESALLIETYLATIEQLQPAFLAALSAREGPAGSIPRRLPDGFLETFIGDRSRSESMRTLAIRQLGTARAHASLLSSVAREAGLAALRIEAIRSLAAIATDDVQPVLIETARDRKAPEAVRAEAIVALGWHATAHVPAMVELLDDPAADVRLEAARYLRVRSGPDVPREPLARARDRGEPATAEHLSWALDGPTALRRPQDLDAWQAVLATGGSRARGERVFFSAHSSCSACHRVDGRGGDLGPALTGVGQSKSRAQIVRAILRPSEEVAPDWQRWEIRTTDGTIHVGRQIDIGDKATELYVLPGRFIRVPQESIVSYGPVETSIMPEGLEATMTATELRDLVAFLSEGR
jgi:putative membrane-bound dehydrogenase-like protein